MTTTLTFGFDQDQLFQELHQAVVQTSPVGSILARPVQVHTDLVN